MPQGTAPAGAEAGGTTVVQQRGGVRNRACARAPVRMAGSAASLSVMYGADHGQGLNQRAGR